MLDPYATLQISPDASAEDIKRAYRKLAKELHPDLHPNNPASARRFKDLTAAYDILSDEAKRRQYDRDQVEREARAQASANRRRPEDDPDSTFAQDSAFAQNWGFRRGAGANGRPKLRGADIYQSIRIDFVEAAMGARKRIIVKDERALDIVIPARTEDGQTLRLRAQGGLGTNGGPRGDIFVEVTVEPHAYFTRHDNDIHMILQVSVPEAVLGAAVTVPTVHGPVTLKIPKGSNTETVLRLRGKGLPVDSGFGDQLVTLKVVLPPDYDGEFRSFIEHWAQKHDYPTRPRYS